MRNTQIIIAAVVGAVVLVLIGYAAYVAFRPAVNGNYPMFNANTNVNAPSNLNGNVNANINTNANVPTNVNSNTNTVVDKSNLIRVTTPRANDIVRSPLRVTGQARGSWYFEASFPVRIVDADGRQLGIAPAQATDEWMTAEFVPFELSLAFATSTTATGTLILEKDNPSGLPQFDDELRIPVRFR